MFNPRVENPVGRISNPSPQGRFSVSVDVRLIGPLWAPGVFKRVIERAQATTVDYGKRLIQSRTPVDTGNLRAKWYTTKTDIVNDEYYSSFVEYGTIFFDGRFMATNSINEIEDRYLKEIKNEINSSIGGLVRRFL